MVPHRKHKDNVGRTALARACANKEVEAAKLRLLERPEDIDDADNAGNTPLQIASLEGTTETVKMLIEQGCDVHCVNAEKDTPLLDAAENGHLEVVKLLLDAGVNPRQRNVNGEEPIEKLNPEHEDYEELKAVLTAARTNHINARRASEDPNGQGGGTTNKDGGRSSRSATVTSPRHSPSLASSLNAIETSLSGRGASRSITGRHAKSRQSLLWLTPTLANLREAAGSGDSQAAHYILEMNQKLTDDVEALIAAIRGGHDDTMQLLLGLGSKADPEPIKSAAPGYNTPILVAIGRGNLKVIKLLLDQKEFDPTRRNHDGQTYYDISRERQGPEWESEYDILKEAYLRHIEKHGGKAGASSKLNSPDRVRAQRDKDRAARRSNGHANSSPSEPLRKRELPSPTSREHKGRKHHSEIKRESTDQNEASSKSRPSHKDGTSTIKKRNGDDTAVSISDTESAPLGPPKGKIKKVARSESDAGAVASESDAPKRSRKLVSGKEMRGVDREKLRRSSVTSSASSSSGKEKSLASKGPKASSKSSNLEPSKSARSKAKNSDSDVVGDRATKKTTAHKKEESKLRLNVVRSEGSGNKRPRDSLSPPRSRSRDSESRSSPSAVHKKKHRRLDDESSSTKSAGTSEKSNSVVDGKHRRQENEGRNAEGSKFQAEGSSQTSTAKKHAPNDHVPRKQRSPNGQIKEKDLEETRKPRSSTRSTEEEASGPQANISSNSGTGSTHPNKESTEPDAKSAADAEAKRKSEEAAVAAAKAKAERMAEEIKRKEQAELEQRAAKEEADRKAAIARKEQEAREEAEREERAREAAEAKKRIEEEARRQREIERKRAEREAQEAARKRQLEDEARLARLPSMLQWYDRLPPDVRKSADVARKFLPILGYRWDTIDRTATGPEAQDQWVANIQVAPILGIKDLEMPQCELFNILCSV
jgi:ankyrin repeat protein